MIYFYDHTNLNRWNRGELQVRIDIPGKRLPLGYCDGTEEDEAELHDIAQNEDVENLPIAKKLLKTGRQIWTVGHPPVYEEEDED
ncbi:MAG: hypothetical protein KC912_26650 [Proteobacteria bacterium]|nr:hypothetical protein [Pseudomonadota bacterium]